MGRLDERRVVVTGGGNGLGAEYVRALHEEGAIVAILDRDTHSANVLMHSLGSRCMSVTADVGVRASVEAGIRMVAAQLGGIDILVNNAGIYPHVAFEDITDDQWDEVMRVNLYGVFHCTQAVVPHLKTAGGGKIVNIVTNLVWVMAPFMAHYIASKSGVVGFTRGTARELGAHGITINALAPGANMPDGDLDAGGLARMREIIGYQAIKRPQMYTDLLGAMIFLCSSDADFMTGQVLCVDGGIAVP